MKRHFLLPYLYIIIILGFFDVNASSQKPPSEENNNIPNECAQNLTDSHSLDVVQKLSFEESILIPDDYRKRQLLEILLKNIDESKRELILRVGIIRDIQQQNEMLLNIIGLDIHTIDRIRSRRILDIHPIEYMKFTTLPSASSVYIHSGAIISRVNKNGYLENVIITRVERQNVYVRLRKSTEESMISKQSAYQPILVGKQVYYPDPLGIPIRTHITSIKEDGRVSIAYLGNEIKIETDQLELKPRIAMSTGKQDLSEPITSEMANDIRRSYLKIERLYSSPHDRNISAFKSIILRRDIIRLNNDLMRRLSVEMYRQGIVTRLELEPMDILENRTDYVLRLLIDGIHENGNEVMRSYLERAEEFNVPSIKVSLFPFTIGIRITGSTNLIINEIELNIIFALNILKKEEDLDIGHELTHAMITSDVYANKSSIYHTQFIAMPQKAKIDLYDNPSNNSVPQPYSQDLNYQEIYAQISDLIFLSREPFKNLREIVDKINTIKMINRNTQQFVDNLLQNFDINHKIEDIKYHYIRDIDVPLRSLLKNEVNLNPFINYWQEDNYGRVIGIRLPEQTKETLKYLITRLSSFEIQKLVESISGKVPEAYIEFLKQNPTADQILDYSAKNPDSFLESVEKEVIKIKREEASKILNQEFKRQLDQIKDISVEISEQLAHVESILEQIQATPRNNQVFIETKNKLFSAIRNLYLITLRAL